VQERQGVPATCSMSGISRPNPTGLERTGRMAAARRVDGGGGEGSHRDAHRVGVNSLQVAVAFHAVHARI